MKAFKCKDKNIKKTLVDYVCQELSTEEARRTEAHLGVCRSCREEHRVLERIHRESLRLEKVCNAEMQSIDWEETAQTVSRAIPFNHYRPSASRKVSFHFNWKLAVPVITAVFFLGLWLGYFLFHISPQKPLLPGKKTVPGVSLDRLENTLAKREVGHYFKQSQLVLTDLMKQCNADGSFSLKNQVDMERVRALLSKNRYFSQNLNQPDLLSSRKLLKKIEWLLYEIIMTDEETSCQQLQRLQDYIKQERLLFKIRLVGKELHLNEV